MLINMHLWNVTPIDLSLIINHTYNIHLNKHIYVTTIYGNNYKSRS